MSATSPTVKRRFRTVPTNCLLLPNTLPHFRELEEYWRLSPDGWRERLSAAWPGAWLEVAGHGNCLVATAAQLGLAFEELTRAELDAHDPRYPVLTTIVCRRPQ